jgi:osmoprotectant transport system permease protein
MTSKTCHPERSEGSHPLEFRRNSRWRNAGRFLTSFGMTGFRFSFISKFYTQALARLFRYFCSKAPADSEVSNRNLARSHVTLAYEIKPREPMKLRRTVFMALVFCTAQTINAEPLNVGSKRFTESYIVAEIIKQTADATGEAAASHQQGLGNTAIVLSALQTGSIDIYPEYTGTIAREILKLDNVPPLSELNAKLAPMGLAVSTPLGFNNTYALAIRAELAASKKITRLSDLKNFPALRLGLSQEFIGRADGWPGLKQKYALPFDTPRGLDHGLAYEAIAQGQVDVIDIYSTDAKIGKYQMVVLEDDLQYFPRYDAVLLHKENLAARLPKTFAALAKLEGRISESAMRKMNAAAELDKKSFAVVASEFLSGAPSAKNLTAGSNFWQKLFGADFGRLLSEHLALVFLSLLASIAVGIPLGIIAARHRAAEALILGITGVLQTIPSLALLAILIPITGKIGLIPAFIALAIYALLPIVRNTHAGLTQVSTGITQAAQSLGMTSPMILRHIELPLARQTILAGIKTSAVINVGTATIAAFIGAGGFGERIVTGLALNDNATLLAGAIPVAMLALLIEAAFNVGERVITPTALRKRSSR